MQTSFKTNLWQEPGGNNTGIVVPEENVLALDAGKKPPVDVTVNGYTYKSTVAVMGGQYMLPFASEHRKNSGIKGGDAIEVTLVLDDKPRVFEVPDALATALDAAGLRAKFDASAPSKRKEWVRQVNEAKSDETRERRITKVIESLA
jgi:hypothetical protein